jgi:hypothetical protein
MQGREPCDPAHVYHEVAHGSFHSQLSVLHHNDCNVSDTVSQVGPNDTFIAKVGAQCSQQNTKTEPILMYTLGCC